MRPKSQGGELATITRQRLVVYSGNSGCPNPKYAVCHNISQILIFNMALNNVKKILQRRFVFMNYDDICENPLVWGKRPLVRRSRDVFIHLLDTRCE